MPLNAPLRVRYFVLVRYENLPREVQFSSEKERDLSAKYMRTLANSGLSAVSSFFDSDWDIMTDYDKILTNVLKDKKMVKRVAGKLVQY